MIGLRILAFFVILAGVFTATPYSFNIEDYGADPSGSEDSYNAIQTALDKAAAIGGTVIIPPGNFKINRTLEVTNTITISGVNHESSVITGQSGSFLLNIQGARGVIIENLGFVGNEGTSALRLYKAFLVTLKNLQMTQCDVGLWIEQTGNIDVMTVNIWAHHLYGVRILDVNGDIFLDKIHINNFPNQKEGVYGFYLSNVSGAKITNSDAIASFYGVMMDLASSQPNPANEWVQFLSVDCDTVGGDPWHIVDATGLQLSECWSGTFLSGTGVWLGPGVDQASIVNHQWQNGNIGIGNNANAVTVTGGIMGSVHQHVDSSVAGQPVIMNVVGF